MQPENPLLIPAQPPVPAPVPEAPHASGRKKWGALGTVGALLFKFKTFLLLALTKGKLVLLGLTKLNTLLSMLA